MSTNENNSINRNNEIESKRVINDFSKDVIYKTIGKEHSEEKHKEGHSTLCNTVENSVHHPDNDITVDTEIKEVNFSKTIFTDSIDKTKKECKENEYGEEIKRNNKENKSHSKEEILYSLDDLDEQNWNQFEENEKLYKVNSTYTEKQYNTEIDLQKVPEQLKKAAEQIEKELKMNKTKSTHINEERGIEAKEDETEEARYSSVVRNSNTKNKTKPKIQSKKNEYSILGFSCWKILLIIFLIFSIFISYRIHKISQRISIENDEEINIIYESSNIEEIIVENLNMEE